MVGGNSCRFIAFSELKQKFKEVGAYLRFMKPDFHEDLSEECTLDGD